MSRHGAGVFQHVLHVIPDDAGEIEFHGLTVKFAACNVPCVPIEQSQESPPEGAWPPCHPCAVCFPTDQTPEKDAEPG